MDQTQPSPTSGADTTMGQSDGELVPGKLRGNATLTLQTQQAARLVRGRTQTSDKPAIIGLLGFAALCRTIWHGAYGDDPYAYWWQQKIDDALTDAQSSIESQARRLDEIAVSDCGLQVAPARSEKPARIALNFTNPDAFRAAQLIARYDQLACRALTLAHTGQVTRQVAEQALNVGGRAVRRTLQSAMGYRFFGIDRIAVLEQSGLAVEAREAMGECPETLLERLESEIAIVRRAGSAPVGDIPEQSLYTKLSEDSHTADIAHEAASDDTP
ncbi:MAG: hypothetical protein Cons2KO_33200 [Congregibacter sp.]